MSDTSLTTITKNLLFSFVKLDTSIAPDFTKIVGLLFFFNLFLIMLTDLLYVLLLLAVLVVTCAESQDTGYTHQDYLLFLPLPFGLQAISTPYFEKSVSAYSANCPLTALSKSIENFGKLEATVKSFFSAVRPLLYLFK